MFVLMIYIYVAYNIRVLVSTAEVSFETSSRHFTGHPNIWNDTSASTDIFRSTTTYLNKNNISTSSSIFPNNGECFQNVPINRFLVIITIQLLSNDNSSSADFKSDLEAKLTSVYREAQTLRNSSSLNISAIVFNVTERSGDGGELDADILYYLVQYASNSGNKSTCISAESAKSLMDFILRTKGLQYLTLRIGRIVVVPISLFLVEPIKQPSNQERIGLIAGGVTSFVVGCLLIMWLILYCYFKCQLARKVYCNKGVMCQMDEQPIYEGDGVKSVGDHPREDAEVSPGDKQSKANEMMKKERKKFRKKSKQRQSRGKTLSPVEDPNLGSLSGLNVSSLGLDKDQAIQNEIKPTPPLPDNVSTNAPPPTGTLRSLSPLFQVVGRSLAVWNPYRAADESRRIMQEHKKNQTTNNNTRTISPAHPESSRRIGKEVTSEGPIEIDELHLGPISRADMRAKLNLIRLLRERGMLDENYSSVVLDSRVYL